MKIIRPKTEILWLGTVDDGKKLLITSEIEGVSYDPVTITADDEDESLWFEIVVNDYVVQIPISVVQKAIESASDEVHSESWYEKNVYTNNDT
ncbi:hypothetical protein [Hahella sp. HN01]|uniref:hypothetical protein n=1 Tax=Hahella sp. HN01 TaxID=2847262 RepID=UPI001C1EAF12|nr:hypothetical protein [Hahella sp. HN01]MBU6955937.1 hypothetical protein [Hahella sp. HN01]